MGSNISARDIQAMLPLIAALAVIIVIVMAADVAILIRWLLYRARLYDLGSSPPAASEPQDAERVPPASSAMQLLNEFLPPVPMPQMASGGAGVATWPQAIPNRETSPSAPEQEETTPAETAEAAAAIRPPFAPTWSLTHPFLGFQFVFLVANFVALIPLALAVSRLIPHYINAPNRLYTTPLVENATYAGLMVGTLAQNVLFVAVPYFFLKRYGLSLASIGLNRPRVRQILLGIGLGLALFAMANCVEEGVTVALQHLLSPQAWKHLKQLGDMVSADVIFRMLPSAGWKAALALLGAVAAPIGEEVFFRGFLYNALKVRLNVWPAIILSGFLFALIHASPLGIVVIFPMGMLLAYVYERTHSLWVTICMHIVNNGLTFLFLAHVLKLGR